MQVIFCESCRLSIASIEKRTQNEVANIALHIAGHALTKPSVDHVLNIQNLIAGTQVSPVIPTFQQQGKLYETMFVDGINIPGHVSNVFGDLLALKLFRGRASVAVRNLVPN